MSLQLTYLSPKQSETDDKFSTDENCLRNMSNNNKISTKFELARTEHDEYLKTKFEHFQAEVSNSINIKASALNSKIYPSSYDQLSADIIKWTLLK